MKKIWRKYPEVALFALAFVLLGAIIAYFTWGIGTLIGQVNRGVNGAPASPPNVSFNFKGAQALDLRGLVKPTP